MKALLFGANGQLGRALASTAPEHVDLVGLGRAQCNIGDSELTSAIIADLRPDLVINAAAYTAVDRAESEREEAEAINAVAPGHIAAAARMAGARMVHVSTDYVFDGAGTRPYRPDDATAPLGVYGGTKLVGEHAAIAAHPGSLIVRTAWVYAAHGANFMTTMLRLMNEHDELSVVDDQLGTPTYARSLAKALWTLAEDGATGIWHFTDAGVASWYDFAVAIFEEAASAGIITRNVTIKPVSTDQYPTPARRPRLSLLDKSKTWEKLGVAAPHWRANLRLALKDLSELG